MFTISQSLLIHIIISFIHTIYLLAVFTNAHNIICTYFYLVFKLFLISFLFLIKYHLMTENPEQQCLRSSIRKFRVIANHLKVLKHILSNQIIFYKSVF